MKELDVAGYINDPRYEADIKERHRLLSENVEFWKNASWTEYIPLSVKPEELLRFDCKLYIYSRGVVIRPPLNNPLQLNGELSGKMDIIPLKASRYDEQYPTQWSQFSLKPGPWPKIDPSQSLMVQIITKFPIFSQV